MSLGTNIYRLRTGRNLSQGDLAEALGVSRQSISKWETDSAVPDLDKLLALSDLFGVSLDTLVRGASDSAVSPGDKNTGDAGPSNAEPHSEPVPPHTTNTDGDTSTFRTILICILVFLVLSLFASLLTPLLAGSLHFILIGIGCLLFALRK